MNEQFTVQLFSDELAEHEDFRSVTREVLVEFATTIAECIETDDLLSGSTPLDSVVLSRASSGTVVTGSSIKLRNAWFDLGKLFEVSARGVFTLAGVASLPWLAPFALLLLYRQLRDRVDIELRAQDALALLGLWRSRAEGGDRAVAATAYLLCIDISLGSKLPPLSQGEFKYSLEKLCSLGCIEPAGEGVWRLVERVHLP